MSVDRTIDELSGTLAQLGQLVGHINQQIGGITGRINATLDNFDRAVAGIAMDASSVTGQVGDTVSQVPNSWVFYVLFITLIIVFILLSVVLCLNLITKVHSIYAIVKGIPHDGSERSLIVEDSLPDRHYEKGVTTIPLPEYNNRHHVAISMEAEPRRPGRRDPPPSEDPRPYQRRFDENAGRYNLETGMTSSYPRTVQGQDV